MTKNHLLVPTDLKSIMDVVGIPMDEISAGNCLPLTTLAFSRSHLGFLTFEDMNLVTHSDGKPVVKSHRQVKASINTHDLANRLRPDTVVIIGKRAILVGQ